MLETSFVAPGEITSFAVVEVPMLKGLKNVLVILVGGVVDAAVDVVVVIVDVVAIDVVVASDEVICLRLVVVSDSTLGIALVERLMVISFFIDDVEGTVVVKAVSILVASVA